MAGGKLTKIFVRTRQVIPAIDDPTVREFPSSVPSSEDDLMSDSNRNTRRPAFAGAALALILVLASTSNLWGQVRIDVTNHGLDAVPTRAVLDGDRVVFLAKEGPWGEDLNGDGDKHDNVVRSLDLSKGTGLNFQLAGGDAIVLGDLMTFGVSERYQAETDYNGDGDAGDWIQHVFRFSTGETLSLGLDGWGSALGEDFVAFMVDEARQGEDLNGDRDLRDRVAHIYDARSMTTTNLMESTWSWFVAGDDYAAFHVQEEAGNDLNGDGDFSDRVLHVYDASNGTVRNVGVASWQIRLSGDLVVFQVREYEQGEDLTGDGDLGDRVLHIYDRRTDEIHNVGLFLESWDLGESLMAFSISEGHLGRALNGDDDLLDRVMHVYDLETNELVNLEIAGGFDPHIAGRRVAFRVSEKEQGETDFNGDGDATDYVMHVYDHDSGVVRNLGLAATVLASSDDRSIAFNVSEAAQGTDFNNDDALDDDVLHFYDLDTETLLNLGLVVEGGWAHAQGRLAFFVPEDENGYVDLNGDPDQFVDVLHVFDGNFIHNLGIQGSDVVFDGETLVFVVDEEWNGSTDLNSDGDVADSVLHTAKIVQLDAKSLIRELIVDIRELVAEGEIPYRRGRGLIAELKVALWFLRYDGGERIAAVRIQIFILKVKRMIRHDEVDPDLGAELLARAREIRRLLRH